MGRDRVLTNGAFCAKDTSCERYIDERRGCNCYEYGIECSYAPARTRLITAEGILQDLQDWLGKDGNYCMDAAREDGRLRIQWKFKSSPFPKSYHTVYSHPAILWLKSTQ